MRAELRVLLGAADRGGPNGALAVCLLAAAGSHKDEARASLNKKLDRREALLGS